MNRLVVCAILTIFNFHLSILAENVPMVKLLEDGYLWNFDEPVGKRIEYPENYTGTELTICFWLQPYRYLQSNNILSLSHTLSDISTVAISLQEGGFIFKLPGCLLSLNVKPIIREWRHYCFSKSGDVKIFVGGNLNFTIDCDSETVFDVQKEGIFFRIGWSAQITNPLSGLVADAKLFWRELSYDEIESVSKVEYVPSGFDLLANLSADNNSYAEITEVREEELLEYMPYILLYISEKNSYGQAAKVCKVRRGLLPDFTEHGKDTLIQLISQFSSRSGMSIGSFWLNSLNDSTCFIGVYTVRPLDLLVSTQQCNNSKIDYFCVVKKQVQYRLDGFNEHDEEDEKEEIYFHPVPYKIGVFESIGGLRLYLKNGQFFLKDVTSNVIYFVSESRDSDQLLGRYNWYKLHHSEPNKMSFTGCNSHEFTCSDGKCIDFEYLCVYTVWCDDYSDEDVSLCEVGFPPQSFYDKKLPPSSQSNFTTNITIEFELARLLDISKDDGTISIFINCVLKWQDVRLDFKFLNRNDSISVSNEIADKYWQPDLAIIGATHGDMLKLSFKENPGNVKAKMLEEGIMKVINSYRAMFFEGDQVLLISENSVPVTIICDLNLFYFPFNEQTCTFALKLLTVNENLTAIEFETSTSKITMGSGVFHSVYEIFDFKYRFTNTNDIVLEAIGLITLFLPTHDYNDRFATTFSLLMSMSSLFSQISGSLPASAEPKLMDIWMFTHVLCILLIFIDHIIICNLDDVQTNIKISLQITDRKQKQKEDNDASENEEISGGILEFLKAKWE
ncbi:5-hydroxytryptamine receptor 3C [Armadillidium vulgare]|nr:5-hydroxytryptamine receptor 3C [Armadillidium vulgare]